MATATCSGCKADEDTENLVTIRVQATVDGHNSKHHATFCMLCWHEDLQPKLQLTPPAQPTGSFWESTN